MRLVRLLAAGVATLLFSLSLTASAQDATPPIPLSQDQLDGLLAPIALYPDQLLTQVLIASTYPLEVVEAARFVKANPTLKGQALEDALRDKTWDASVLSLAAFPQVLDMMDAHLEWTQRLGDAFLADEAAVMRTVQALRQRAEQAGNLRSTEQQTVVVQDRNIIIEPAQPEYVYVPVYNPTVIYGPWWAPDYLPWYWYPPPIWGYAPAPSWWGYTAGFSWGTAWAIGYNNWGWARPNWYNHSVNINVGNNYWLNRPQYRERYPGGGGNWSHSPEHRRGVAYRDPGTSNRYRPTNPGAIQSRESYRGRDQMPGTRPVPGVARASRGRARSRRRRRNVRRRGRCRGRPVSRGCARPRRRRRRARQRGRRRARRPVNRRRGQPRRRRRRVRQRGRRRARRPVNRRCGQPRRRRMRARRRGRCRAAVGSTRDTAVPVRRPTSRRCARCRAAAEPARDATDAEPAAEPTRDATDAKPAAEPTRDATSAEPAGDAIRRRPSRPNRARRCRWSRIAAR